MKIGLIGAGAVARSHAEAATTLPEVQISAVCDLNQEAARSLAATHGARSFTDYRDLIAEGGADAVIISTPHSLHHEMVLAAARAGLDVLVEKPMAIEAAECVQMQQACADAEVHLAVGHIQHFLPDKVAAREAVFGGRIGEVVLVHDYRSTDYRPGTRAEWFFRPEIAGGGALMNIGAHMVDRCSWLTGARFTQVEARLQYRFGVGVETDADLRLELAGGIPATITVVSAPPATVDEVLLVGSTGTIVADPRRGTFLRDEDGVHVLHEAGEEDIPQAFVTQLRGFADFVAGRAQFAVDTQDSIAVIATVQGAYRSAREGGPVQLPEPAELAAATAGASGGPGER